MIMEEQLQRSSVLRIAKGWLGTPFHDLACLKGAGVDCAMFVKAVFEEAGLINPLEIPYYSPQWFLHRGEERYLTTVMRFAWEIEDKEIKPADLVLFKLGKLYAHGAIIMEPGWPNIIHAYKPEKCVTIGLGDNGELGRREKRFFRFNGWEK